MKRYPKLTILLSYSYVYEVRNIRHLVKKNLDRTHRSSLITFQHINIIKLFYQMGIFYHDDESTSTEYYFLILRSQY